MKTSMWMIASRLKEWKPRLEIVRGEPGITRVRMFSGTPPDDAEGTLFAGPARDLYDDPGFDDTVMLSYQEDRIFIQGQRPADVMNAALAALDFYDSWEQAVLDAVGGENPFQRILDLSDTVLENPATLFMLDGSLVAWSKRYEAEPINSFWNHLMKHKTMPPFLDYGRFTSPDGTEVKDWSFEPREYRTGEGALLGFYVGVEKEPVATFSVTEYGRPFEPADIQCLDFLNGIFSHIAATREQSPIRPAAAVLEALLNGEEPERPLLNQLGRALPPAPWTLLVCRALDPTNTRVSRGTLERQLRRISGTLFLVDYGNTLVALCAREEAETLEKEIKNNRLHEHWQFGVSLPFPQIADLPFRYRQALFAIEQGVIRSGRREMNGFWLCKDYAFEQILAVVSRDSHIRELLHPALDILERYDAEHNSNLGETLLCYLANERNTTLSAEMLRLHRNSLLHRMERIETLTGTDLDNPGERAYLYFSWLVKDAIQKSKKV